MSHHTIRSVSVHPLHGQEATGLKRQLFKTTLGGVDLLVGANGAGKSTQGVIAVNVGVEGLAERPTDPRRIFLGFDRPENTGLTLEVQTPSGIRYLTRDLSLTSRAGASKEADGAAQELIGIPPTAWDLSDFAKSTANERGTILDAVARAGGQLEAWDQARAISEVEDRMRGIAADKEIDGDLADWLAPLEKAKGDLTRAESGADWLKACETWADGYQKTTNAAQRAAKAHLEKVVESAPPAVEGDAAADSAERSRLVRELAGMDGDAEAVEAARQALARHEQEGERLRRQLASTEADGKRLAQAIPAPSDVVDPEIKQRLDDALAAMDAPVPAYDGQDPAELQRQAQEAARAVDIALAEQVKKAEASKVASQELAEIEDRVAALRRTRDAAEGNHGLALAKVETLQALGNEDAVCEHCGQADPLGIQAKVRAAEEEATATAQALDQASTALDAAQQPLEAAVAWAEQAAADAKDAEEDLHEARATVDRLKAAADAARAALGSHADRVRADRQRELDAARRAMGQETRRISEARQQHERQEQQRQKDYEAAKGRWRANKAALAEWAKAAAPVVPEAPSEEQRQALRDALAEVEGRIAARLRFQQHQEQVRDAFAAAESARLAWDATRALVQATRGARDALAAAAYGPIDTICRSMLAETPDLPQPYFAGPDDYGAIIAGRGRVNYDGLSQSEKLIAAAAIVCALATVAGNPCRLVLLDGIEVVDSAHRPALVTALVRARAEGLVDNVVMTMATPAVGTDEFEAEIAPYREIAGLTIHEVERQDTADNVTSLPRPAANSAPAPALVTDGTAALAPDDDCPF